jgi:hypothetical protein
MATRAKRTQSPITLFVEAVDFKPEIDMNSDRETVIDLEIKEMDAQKIVKELNQRLERNMPFGAIRVRFIGRLVL